MSSTLFRLSHRSPSLRAAHPTRLHGALPNRRLHVRPISILGGVGRLAGRTAGRGVIGLGAGLGGLTWAEWKVDGE